MTEKYFLTGLGQILPSSSAVSKTRLRSRAMRQAVSLPCQLPKAKAFLPGGCTVLKALCRIFHARNGYFPHLHERPTRRSDILRSTLSYHFGWENSSPPLSGGPTR